MNKRAFTLIEILMSLGLLVVITISFSFLFKSGFTNLKYTEDIENALYATRSQMEEIRAESFDNIKSKTFANGRGMISVKSLSHDLLEIKLSYNWNANKKPIELYTIRSKY